MSNTKSASLLWRLKSWQIILIFGVLLWIIYGFGSFTLDFFAGAATAEFGQWGNVGGVGLFFVYILSFYIALVVVLPILIIQRFGVGVAVFLPYALTGFFIEYYFDWIVAPALRSPWGAVGWCVIGLAIGLSADLTYRFLPNRFTERLRAVTTGYQASGRDELHPGRRGPDVFLCEAAVRIGLLPGRGLLRPASLDCQQRIWGIHRLCHLAAGLGVRKKRDGRERAVPTEVIGKRRACTNAESYSLVTILVITVKQI
jgi:hypothetical protein